MTEEVAAPNLPKAPKKPYGKAVKLKITKNKKVLLNGNFRYVLEWLDSDGNVVFKELYNIGYNDFLQPDETSFNLNEIIEHQCSHELFVNIDKDELEVVEVVI
jgi:hypothetical protein